MVRREPAIYVDGDGWFASHKQPQQLNELLLVAQQLSNSDQYRPRLPVFEAIKPSVLSSMSLQGQIRPLLRHLFAESLFCPWSAHGRHLMGLDEEEASQSRRA